MSFNIRGGAFSDSEYGWAKLMGEMSLQAFHRQYGLKASSIRLFTAYGPRENESHAIIALIAKAFIKQSPFDIWGDGQQTRNFTYVDDIVDGFLLGCQNIENGSAVNAGTSDFISLVEASEEILKQMNWMPDGGFTFSPHRPVGPIHRAADTRFAKRTTGWQSRYSLAEGLSKTIEWYLANKDVETVRRDLEALLMQRGNRN